MSDAAPPVPETPLSDSNAASPPGKPALWQQLLPWAITLVCFAYLYTKISGAAARDGLTLVEYFSEIFGRVSWTSWLALMIPYSIFFFLIDSLIVWRVISWFNVPISYTGILPIRGSSYILSILNEQVGKGAMGLYLNRRYGVPGWEVGSSMIFIMFCEFFYLTSWATVGYMLVGDRLPDVFSFIPVIAIGAAIFFALWIAFFRGPLGKNAAREEKHPERDRYGSHGSGCGSPEEDDREVAQHLQEVGVDVEEPKRQGVDHDGCKEGGRAKHDHAEITKQACFAE